MVSMGTVDKLDFFTTISLHSIFCQVVGPIMNESTEFSFMPTTTATAPAKAPRKRRTRKATAVKATPTKVVAVKTPTKPAAKPVAKVSRPSESRLISFDRYVKDFNQRWAIHQWEVNELVKDISKGVSFVTPYHAELVKTVKQWTV